MFQDTVDFNSGLNDSLLISTSPISGFILKLNQSELTNSVNENKELLDTKTLLYPNPSNGQFSVELDQKNAV